MISREDIQKLATLSRMKLTSEEEEKFAKDLESILGYVTMVKNATGSVEERGNEKHINALRDDDHAHDSGIHTEAILNEAPKRKGDFVEVKKILGS